MHRIVLIAGLAIALTAGTTAAAQSAPLRVRGTIAQVTAANVRITYDRALTLDDINPGDFIGTGATRQPDGTLVADEVTVFPESARGLGEGQRPWIGGPNSTMTNANVDQVVVGTSGRTMKLSYKGGTADVVVPPTTPIVTFVPGDRSLLIPGKEVVAFLRSDASGTVTAAALTVEKDGVKPP
jgi:hypothetical protein